MGIMLTKVFKYVKKYKIDVSINLDYFDLINPMTQDILIKHLNQYNIGSKITIEILESEKIHDFDLIHEFIKKLKKFGVLIAIDDFGSGFSNYEQILQLNVDYIKLDGSIVKKINEKIYYNLIKSIVSFASEQNIKVIAEFVSDLSTYRYVKSINIDFVQGYYFGKPSSIKEIVNNE